MPNGLLFEQMGDLICIAADGAAGKLCQSQFYPNLIVGDCDSLSNHNMFDSCELIQDKDQSTTDFEKCLKVIAARKLFPSLVCGIGGGEIDHAHNNLACFMRYARDFPMAFIDKQPGCATKLGLPVYCQVSLKLSIPSTISLLPFPKAVVKTLGLKWPLKNEMLSMLGRGGARNRSVSSRVKITTSFGSLLVVVEYEALKWASIRMD